jgi:Gas vesicle synthesis protein GvpL/GvpF
MIGLYAIALGAARDLTGAQGEPLRVLRLGELELVHGEAAPPLSAEALRAHEAAVRRIAERALACIPARFGCCAADETALSQAIEARRAELAGALRLVRGREEMTLRVLGMLASAPSAGGPGTRYLEQRRRATTLPELGPLRSALASLVRAERVEGHSEPGVVASVYHLVDRGAAAAYRRAVEGVRLDGLRVAMSGPWPAWSFAPDLQP